MAIIIVLFRFSGYFSLWRLSSKYNLKGNFEVFLGKKNQKIKERKDREGGLQGQLIRRCGSSRSVLVPAHSRRVGPRRRHHPRRIDRAVSGQKYPAPQKSENVDGVQKSWVIIYQAPSSYGSGRYGFGVFGAQDSVLRDRCSVGPRHAFFSISFLSI